MVKNLLKKGCLVVSVLLGLGSNVQAQETSVTFNVSDEDKTLTISGQGDLTTYQKVSDELKFTETGAKKVSTVNNQYNNNPVGASAVYNAATSYYAYYPKKIASLYPEYVNAESVTTSWNEDKLEDLYYYGQNTTTYQWEWMKVNSSDAIHDSDTDCKWMDNKKYSNYSTTQSDEGRILFDTFVSEYIVKTLSGITFKDNMKQYLYVISDNKYVKLAEDAVYDENETYYYWNASSKDLTKVNFGSITQDEMIRMGYLEHPKETLAEILNYKLTKSNTFETIQFVNNGTGAMTIDKDIVKAILYPGTATDAKANSVLTTLDLGAATCKDFSNETFAADGVKGTLALTNLTLPLTNKTRVLNEGTGTNVDKMVVPTQVISKLNPVPTTVTIPEGYDRVGDKAFENSLITNINFPKTLTLIGESAFYKCKNIASITLNEGLENIGKKAFMDTPLTALHFPSTLQIIHDEAFRNCYVYGLKFNAGLKFIGKGAFALRGNDKAETTLEIPASMRYIGAIAFGARQYQDVFFYGENAPLMPFGTIEDWSATASAFDEVTLMGNNGFDPKKGEISDDANTGYANRENYKNHGVYFCLLHYPKDLTDEQRAAYTDITRVYKTVDEGHVFHYGKYEDPYSYHEVGQEETELKFGNYTASKRTSLGFQDTYLGRQYIWPSQDAWRRSYVVNSLGYNWNGIDKYLPTLSDEDLNVLAYAGYKVADGDHPADKATGYYTLDDLRMMAHMGTRQFPLGNEDVNVDEEPEEEPTYPINIKGGQWWTICVPFDMTKKQVDNVFGEGTHVCRFNKVERVVNSEEKVKSIKLFFTNDVYVHKSTKDKEGHYTTSTGTPVADDDIVIYAHESYMIYPTNNNDDANNMYNISDYTLVTGSPLPTLVKATEQFTGGAKESASGDASWNKEYRFVGNYQTEVAVSVSEDAQNSEAVARDIKNVTVPQYSYIYAKKKDTPNAQFWFYKGTEMLWGANKCVVQATARGGGLSDYKTYFDSNVSAPAKELSFFGTDDEVTGIENVEIIAGNENDTQIVYNLNGQVVNGNLNSLQKGIYIKNGKKFMVK